MNIPLRYHEGINMDTLKDSLNIKSQDSLSLENNKIGKFTISSKETHGNKTNELIPKTFEEEMPRDTNDPSEETIRYLKNFSDPKNLPEGFDKWSHKDQYDYVVKEVGSRLKTYPKSLLYYFPGSMHPGDSGKPLLDKPDWLDMEKFKRGQKFATDHFLGVAFAIVISIFGTYTFKDGIKPIIFTGNSSSPYEAFRRYRSTLVAIQSWYTDDIWSRTTRGYKKIIGTRKKHLNLINQLSRVTNEELNKAATMTNAWCPMRDVLLGDFQSDCPAASIFQRPYILLEDAPSRPKPFSQTDMNVTQFNMVGLIVMYPEYFTMRSATDEDLDAFCHVWRGIGYLLGVEDEYNFCAGSLEEIRARSRDIIEFWIKPNFREITPEWEHITRCVAKGISYYLYIFPYESMILYLTDMLQLPMRRFRAAVTYYDWFIYKMTRLLILHLPRLPGVRSAMNKLLVYLINNTYRYSSEKHMKLKKESTKIMESIVRTK